MAVAGCYADASLNEGFLSPILGLCAGRELQETTPHQKKRETTKTYTKFTGLTVSGLGSRVFTSQFLLKSSKHLRPPASRGRREELQKE